MDLRGFPQVNMINNQFSGTLTPVKMLDNLMSSEIMTRGYVTTYRKPHLYSMNSTLNKCIEIIQNNNLGLENFLKSVDISTCDENGLTFLKTAVSCLNVDATKMILAMTSYVLRENDLNILVHACEQMNYNSDTEIIISELLRCLNIDVNKSGGYQKEIPLYYAINADINMNIVKLLLSSNKINVNLPINTGQSLIHYAITNRRDKATLLLIDNKDIIFSKEDLDCIFGGGSIEVINHLLNIKKFKITNDEHFIQMIKRNGIPLELCKSYTNINYQDVHGKTALMYAAEMNNIEKLEFLLSNLSIDLSVVDNNNMNALLLATTNKNYICVKLILEHNKISKEIVNQKNESCETSLIIATKNNDNAVFKILYKSQLCDINGVDAEYHTSLYHAIDNNNLEMFNCLCENPNVDVNIQDFEGNTVIYKAVEKSKYDMIYKLLACNRLDLNIVNNYNQNILSYVLHKKYHGRDETFSVPKQMDGEFAAFPGCYESSTDNKYMALVNDRSSLDNQMSSGSFISTLTGNTKSANMDEKLIKYLIKKDIELNNFDVYDKSILTQVIDQKDKVIFNALLQSNNLNVNAQNNQGETYLIYLFKKIDQNDSSSGLTTRSAINKVSDNWMNEPIHIASEYKMSSIQPEINFSKETTGSFFKPMNGPTCRPVPKNPIKLPTKLDSNQTIFLTLFMQLLSHSKININATDYTNSTLLSYVVEYNNVNLLSKVLKHKEIDVNVQDDNGVTPFMRTISRQLWDNAKLLLQNNANMEMVDNEGHSAKNYLTGSSLNIYDKLFGNNKNQVQENTQEANQDIKNQPNKRWFF